MIVHCSYLLRGFTVTDDALRILIDVDRNAHWGMAELVKAPHAASNPGQGLERPDVVRSAVIEFTLVDQVVAPSVLVPGDLDQTYDVIAAGVSTHSLQDLSVLRRRYLNMRHCFHLGIKSD